MKWFKHDSNANADAKLKRVRMKYGMEGYGLYWYCLELIASGVEKHNIRFELEHDAEIISHDTGINRELVEEMMKHFIKLELFENSSGLITCMKMLTRTDDYIGRITTKSLRTNSEQTPNNQQTKSWLIEENRIEEKKKGRRFTPPSIDQVMEYCRNRNNSVNPQNFIDHYEANGWMRGKTKIKCWKSCVRTWERKEEAKSYDPTEYYV